MNIVSFAKHRHWIPLSFGIAFVVFFIFMQSLSGGELTAKVHAGVEDNADTVGPFLAKKDHRYMLHYEAIERLRTGYSGPVEVSLYDAETNELVLTLEDWFWAESGIWREDGESGTWYEANDKQTLYFYIPHDGAFNIALSTEIPTRLKVTVEREAISALIPFLAFISFLWVAFYVYRQRQMMLLHMIGNLDVGSELIFDDDENDPYQIASVTRYFKDDLSEFKVGGLVPNAGSSFSVSYKLVSSQSIVSYLDIETLSWEYSFRDSEGDLDDRIAKATVILLSRPDLQPKVNPESQAKSVSLQGRSFFRCPENSGAATSASWIAESTVVQDFDENIYLDGQVEMVMNDRNGSAWGIPQKRGDILISGEAPTSKPGEERDYTVYEYMPIGGIKITKYVPAGAWPEVIDDIGQA